MTLRKGDPRKSHRWHQVRAQVLESSTVCWLCSKPGATEVDHVLPYKYFPELVFELSNLRPAHKKCNSAKGAGAPGAHQAPMPRSRRW
jgi:5-methylcytosine-specific restriction endonuclease McrA